MNKASKRYSDEFKKEVIDYSLQNNSSVKEIRRLQKELAKSQRLWTLSFRI